MLPRPMSAHLLPIAGQSMVPRYVSTNAAPSVSVVLSILNMVTEKKAAPPASDESKHVPKDARLLDLLDGRRSS